MWHVTGWHISLQKGQLPTREDVLNVLEAGGLECGQEVANCEDIERLYIVFVSVIQVQLECDSSSLRIQF